MTSLFARLAAVLPACQPVRSAKAGTGDVPDQATLRGALPAVRSALAAIRNDLDRPGYIKVGSAIRAALADEPEEGFALFASWARSWSGAELGDDLSAAIESDWRSFAGPRRVGAPWLYEQAELRGWTGRAAALAADVGARLFDATPLIEEPETLFPADPPPLTLEVLSFADACGLALTDTAIPLIRGVLDCGAMSVLYGESNVGKSFVALDMAFHIAEGMPWAGHETRKIGVLYVAAEGGRGVLKRAKALAKKHARVPGGFSFIRYQVDLLHTESGHVEALIAAAREVARRYEIGLIIVDTLSRTMAGGDENSSKDMGAFVTNVGRLQAATGAHVMVIHHTGKDKARGARGHSLLRAATDTEIEVDDGVIRATKQRDLEGSFSVDFELSSAFLGVSNRGDPVTSATVQVQASTQPSHAAMAAWDRPVGKATDGERIVLEALHRLGSDGATVKTLWEALAVDGGKMTDPAVRTLLVRLKSKRLVTQAGRTWKTRPGWEPVGSGGDLAVFD